MRSINRVIIISVLVLLFTPGISLAATNIDSTNKWAWNDVRGWLNFYSSTTVSVSSNALKGYAAFDDTSGDYIALDCVTSPNGNICASSSFSIVRDSSGDLSGWAWNDKVGWISFNCSNTSTCGTVSYKVNSAANGVFTGWAWNDLIGWISFNCSDISLCDTSDYYVATSFGTSVAANLTSSTFDTGYVNGVAYNSIVWQGTGPAQSVIKFQLATANCSNGATDAPTCATSVGWGGSKVSGDGAFLGSDGTSASYYVTTAPNTPIQIVGSYHNNKRYYRYKIFLNGVVASSANTNVDSTNKWAWNDIRGWFNFYSTNTVQVSSTKVTGYAVFEDIGASFIALDCATSPNGNICSTSNFSVTRNSSTGDLSGWAWNDLIGWISLNCSDPGICVTSSYKVNVAGDGTFTGWAWNDEVGWISFNCSNTVTCGTSSYYVWADLLGAGGGGPPTVNDVTINWSP